nr:MAG TPA: hypothetical protein [Caudoviricetes sp.]
MERRTFKRNVKYLLKEMMPCRVWAKHHIFVSDFELHETER